MIHLPPFSFASVWDTVRQIPEGRVASYGQIAAMLGHPRAARLVGYALSCAPPDVPCQRVVTRTGALSEAFRPFGRTSHRLLLEREGIPFQDNGCVAMALCRWNPQAEFSPEPGRQ